MDVEESVHGRHGGRAVTDGVAEWAGGDVVYPAIGRGGIGGGDD